MMFMTFKCRALSAILLCALAAASSAHAADMTVSGAWVRETLGSGKTTAGYAQIVNHGMADRLLSVSTPAAGMAEVHQSVDDGGMMKMTPARNLEIPAGGETDLKPGGYHVMIMNVTRPLKVGESIDLTFTFEHAGKITVPAKVAPLSATQAP